MKSFFLALALICFSEITSQTVLPYRVNETVHFEQKLSFAAMTYLRVADPPAARALRLLDGQTGKVTTSEPNLVEVTCGKLVFQLVRVVDEGTFDLRLEENGKVLLSGTDMIATQEDDMVIFYTEGRPAYSLVMVDDEGTLMLRDLSGDKPRDILELSQKDAETVYTDWFKILLKPLNR